MSFSSGLTSSRFDGRRQNYFSIDDILTTQQRIACKFEVPVLNMGKIFPMVKYSILDNNTLLSSLWQG